MRPTPGVEVAYQVVIVRAMMRCDGGKDGLAEQHLQFVPAPVVDPMLQELLLPVAQQIEFRLVELLRINCGIGYVIGAAPPRIDMLWPTLPLSVAKDREPHVAVN